MKTATRFPHPIHDCVSVSSVVAVVVVLVIYIYFFFLLNFIPRNKNHFRGKVKSSFQIFKFLPLRLNQQQQNKTPPPPKKMYTHQKRWKKKIQWNPNSVEKIEGFISSTINKPSVKFKSIHFGLINPCKLNAEIYLQLVKLSMWCLPFSTSSCLYFISLFFYKKNSFSTAFCDSKSRPRLNSCLG